MIIMLIMIFGLLFIDFGTKQLSIHFMKGEVIDVIRGVLQFTYYENRGASFGILQDGGIFLVIVSLLATIVFSYLLYRELKKFKISVYTISLVLFIAGAFGNLIDRAFYSFVVDWIHLPFLDYIIGSWNFVFNLADVYLNIAVVLMIIHIIFFYEEKEVEK